jgi:hypothetical protein
MFHARASDREFDHSAQGAGVSSNHRRRSKNIAISTPAEGLICHAATIVFCADERALFRQHSVADSLYDNRRLTRSKTGVVNDVVAGHGR